MKLTRLFDGVFLKCIGIALVKSSGKQYTWWPRYDPEGKIYAWIREE